MPQLTPRDLVQAALLDLFADRTHFPLAKLIDEARRLSRASAEVVECEIRRWLRLGELRWESHAGRRALAHAPWDAPQAFSASFPEAG